MGKSLTRLKFWGRRGRSRPGNAVSSASPTARRVFENEAGEICVDVRGQTCPGYLLAVNKAVKGLPTGTRVRLLVTYEPAPTDVADWCQAKGYRFQGITAQADHQVITFIV